MAWMALQISFFTAGYSNTAAFGRMNSLQRYVRRELSLCSLCSPQRCGLLLGLISSGMAKAVGHSISTLCMLSVLALPFSPKAERNNLSCPPASSKWVTDNPWTSPRGYSVAELEGHWQKTALFKRPETWHKAASLGHLFLYSRYWSTGTVVKITNNH